MGKIFQTSMTVADADKISISMWVRINSASLAAATVYNDPDAPLYYVPLLEFGEYGLDNSYASSGIWAAIPTDLSFIGLKAAVSGRAGSVSYTDCLAGSYDSNANSDWTNAFEYTFQTGSGSEGDPFVTNTSNVPAGRFNKHRDYGSSWFPQTYINTNLFDKLDTWIHIFVAFDTSTATVPITGGGISTAPSCHFVVNGTNIGPFDPIDTQAGLFPSYTVLTGEGVTAIGTPYDILAAAINMGFSTGGGAISTDTAHAPAESGASPNPYPGGVASFTVPSFNIALNGNELGVPGVFFDNSVVQYADVQIWVNQFIDGVTDIAKFLTVTGTTGKPTNPNVSKAAYGNRTFEFVKGKTVFPVNGGTGGSFTKTGTIDDVVGTPSCTVTP